MTAPRFDFQAFREGQYAATQNTYRRARSNLDHAVKALVRDILRNGSPS